MNACSYVCLYYSWWDETLQLRGLNCLQKLRRRYRTADVFNSDFSTENKKASASFRQQRLLCSLHKKFPARRSPRCSWGQCDYTNMKLFLARIKQNPTLPGLVWCWTPRRVTLPNISIYRALFSSAVTQKKSCIFCQRTLRLRPVLPKYNIYFWKWH